MNATYTGMGDVGTTTTQVGGSVGSGLLTAGALTGGPATPWGMGLMIAGGVTMLGTSLLHAFGVGVRNPIEDRDVKTLNELEVLLQQNLQGWNAGSKTTAEQEQRVAYFDQVFAQLAQLCNDPGLGTEWASGCINDRKQGGKWDWYAMYRTPIASATPSDAGSISSLLGSVNPLYLGGAAILVAVLLAKE